MIEAITRKCEGEPHDGEWCATVFDFDTVFGIIPMIDCFHVIDGQILSIRVYYDPRPKLKVAVPPSEHRRGWDRLNC